MFLPSSPASNAKIGKDTGLGPGSSHYILLPPQDKESTESNGDVGGDSEAKAFFFFLTFTLSTTFSHD